MDEVKQQTNLCAAALLVAVPLTTMAPPVKVMTYNIRYSDGDADSADNNWPVRREALAQLVEGERPDVVGFQEVLPDQFDWLRDRFGGYEFVGVGRNADGSGEASPVAFLKDRFNAVTDGTFWLSQTPDEPGSLSWGATFPRICTWAVLDDKESGGHFSFANTHTDHKSEEARVRGMRLIIERMKDFGKGAPIVFVGDHNCLEFEKPALAVSKTLKNAMYESETAPVGPWRTCNHWNWKESEVTIGTALKKPVEERSAYGDDIERIDYIYLTPGARVLEYKTVGSSRGDTHTYASDHFPVIATIVFPS